MKEDELQQGVNQDFLLNKLRKNRTECIIITTNGAHLKGTIESFDNYVILIRSQTKSQSMIYKHAISTVVADQLFR